MKSIWLNSYSAAQIEEMKKLEQRIEEIADQMLENREMTVEMSEEVSQICKLKMTAVHCNSKRFWPNIDIKWKLSAMKQMMLN